MTKKDQANKRTEIIALLVAGIFIILLSVPFYFLFESVMCHDCYELGCAFCGLGAIVAACLVFILGIILTTLCAISLKRAKKSIKDKDNDKNKDKDSSVKKETYDDPKAIVFTTIRWFFIVIFIVVGLFYARNAVSWFAGGVNTNTAIKCTIISLILLGGAVALFYRHKKINDKK